MKKLKNVVIKGALSFLKRPENPFFQDRPKILIASTTALGDTLWATPGIHALRGHFPWAHIGVLTSPIGMEILKENPDIDDLYLFKGSSFFALRRKLLDKRYNIALLFHASQRLPLPLLASIGVSRIIGTKNQCKGLDSLLTEKCENQTHELRRREEILSKLDCEIKDHSLRYFPTFEEKKKASEILQSIRLEKEIPLVILHPGAKDSFKCWPAKNFVELGKKLKASKLIQILVTGGAEEIDLVNRVASRIEGAHVLDQKLSLREFAAVLSQADVIITNDTGPMHLASALEKKVIALFSPTRPENCGPIDVPTAHVIAKPRTCTPCLKRSCRDPFCLRQIGVLEVAEAAQNLLR